MAWSVNFDISKKQMLAKRKQTVVAILGVTFGIAMFILMISFMQGVNQYLKDIMLAATPDIRIYNDIKTDYSMSVAGGYFKRTGKLVVVHHPKPKEINRNIKNATGIIADMKSNPQVLAVSPLLTTQVFYNYGPVQINGHIDGVDIIEETKLYGLDEKMIDGKPVDLLTANNGIIIGSGLAKKLNVWTGDIVTLTTPGGTTMRFRIVGIFQIGLGAIDNVKSYVNLTSVQQLLNKNRSYITDINIKIKNNRYAPDMVSQMTKKYGYKADDWQTANSGALAGELIRNMLTWVVSFTLLVVAGFGIYNIMTLTIASKMKDIAILKAQGFARRDIVQIFLTQSLVIGTIGAITGLLLGFSLSYLLSRVPFPANDEISMKYFPVLFKPQHYGFGILFGVLTTFIAGFAPSIKASRIDPVAILRG